MSTNSYFISDIHDLFDVSKMVYNSFSFHNCEEEFIKKYTSIQMGKHKSEAHLLQRSQILDGSQITVLHAKL